MDLLATARLCGNSVCGLISDLQSVVVINNSQEQNPAVTCEGHVVDFPGNGTACEVNGENNGTLFWFWD